MRNFFYLIISFSIFTSCHTDNKKGSQVDSELNELYGLMQGSFNSAKQAEADSTYYNISLQMYPIWRDHGKYLYVEQALNSMQEKPYRQRIYELKRVNDSMFSSAVYTIDNESYWVGKWKDTSLFDSISPGDITLKEGCEVLLKRVGENHYKGKTGDTTCTSNLRGARYARSQVEIFSDRIESWDRGFDESGNYVWGAEKAGYVFNRLK